MRDQPARMMERAEFHEHIGDENLLPSLEAALVRARDDSRVRRSCRGGAAPAPARLTEPRSARDGLGPERAYAGLPCRQRA